MSARPAPRASSPAGERGGTPGAPRKGSSQLRRLDRKRSARHPDSGTLHRGARRVAGPRTPRTPSEVPSRCQSWAPGSSAHRLSARAWRTRACGDSARGPGLRLPGSRSPRIGGADRTTTGREGQPNRTPRGSAPDRFCASIGRPSSVAGHERRRSRRAVPFGHMSSHVERRPSLRDWRPVMSATP